MECAAARGKHLIISILLCLGKKINLSLQEKDMMALSDLLNTEMASTKITVIIIRLLIER